MSWNRLLRPQSISQKLHLMVVLPLLFNVAVFAVTFGGLRRAAELSQTAIDWEEHSVAIRRVQSAVLQHARVVDDFLEGVHTDPSFVSEADKEIEDQLKALEAAAAKFPKEVGDDDNVEQLVKGVLRGSHEAIDARRKIVARGGDKEEEERLYWLYRSAVDGVIREQLIPLLDRRSKEESAGSAEARTRARRIGEYWFRAALGVSLVALVLVLIPSALFARQLRRRIFDVEGAASRIGRHDFGARLKPGPDDELGRLTRSFNQMAEELELNRERELVASADRARIETLEESRAELERKVAERTAELARANEELSRNLDALRDAQKKLIMADRLAALGTLAAGVAHEINNPLSYVLSNLNYAADELPRLCEGRGAPMVQDEQEREQEIVNALDEARLGAQRVAHIVRDLKTLARGESETSIAVDLHKVLDATVNIAQNTVQQRATVVREYGAAPHVLGSEAKLGQVFLNLLVNAAQAIAAKERLDGQIRLVTRTDGDGNAVVEVHDNGTGIAPGLRDRIFDAFFTSKPAGVGTGLGLSVCHGIVTGLGGSIEVDSDVGVGSTFRVILPPAACDEEEIADEAGEEPPLPRGRVLVVDDEPLVCRAIARILREHDVDVAETAEDALDRLSGSSHYDMVLCDVMMPGMTGVDLYRELLSRAPDRVHRLAFITGGSPLPEVRSFLEECGRPVLEKPIAAERLREAIRWALNGSATPAAFIVQRSREPA